MSVHYIFPDNSKNTYHMGISLTGTDHCRYKLSQSIQFEKTLLIFQYFKKSARKTKAHRTYFGGIARFLCLNFQFTSRQLHCYFQVTDN